MKTIGLIGGLTYVSTLDYYRLLNEMVNEKLGGSEAAKIILYSVNFGTIRPLTFENRWDDIATIICDAARRVELAGAQCLLIGANTIHNIAPQIQQSVSIPVIHIAKETAKEIQKAGLKKVALLGTRFTMLLDFYKTNLAGYGIETIIPSSNEIEVINTAIYDEMSKNIFTAKTKNNFLQIINRLINEGAEGIILGCTEIPLLIQPGEVPVPVFDTTRIHARAAVEFALDNLTAEQK